MSASLLATYASPPDGGGNHGVATQNCKSTNEKYIVDLAGLNLLYDESELSGEEMMHMNMYHGSSPLQTLEQLFFNTSHLSNDQQAKISVIITSDVCTTAITTTMNNIDEYYNRANGNTGLFIRYNETLQSCDIKIEIKSSELGIVSKRRLLWAQTVRSFKGSLIDNFNVKGTIKEKTRAVTIFNGGTYYNLKPTEVKNTWVNKSVYVGGQYNTSMRSSLYPK